MLEGTVLRADVDDGFYPALDDQLGAPETRQFCGVEYGAGCGGYSGLEDAVVLSVDAAATEHLCSYLFTVVAHLASAVVAVDGAVGRAVVASADDLVVFDDDRPDCLFQACCSFLQHDTDVEEVFVVTRSELSDDVLMLF